METLEELMKEHEKELREAAERAYKSYTSRETEAKRKTKREREIQQGLRDQDGNWIFVEEE